DGMEAQSANWPDDIAGSIYNHSSTFEGGLTVTTVDGDISGGGSSKESDGGDKKKKKKDGPIPPKNNYQKPDLKHVPSFNDFITPVSQTTNETKQESKTATNIAGKLVETTAQALEATKQATIGAQKLANSMSGTASEVLNGGKIVEVASRDLAIASAGITVVDGIQHGFKAHHVVDLAISGGIYFLCGSIPVAGWIVGGAYFITNIIVESKTGHSITENLFDSGKY
ncbi:hypothetical protein, partial [Hydrotalea sandarakina]